MRKHLKEQLIDMAVVLGAFCVVLAVAFLVAVYFSPDCLGSAYMYSTPDVSLARECYLVKTPNPNLMKKTRWHLARIEEERSATFIH